MPKEERIIFASEEPRTLAEIGDFLVLVGTRLKDQGFITLTRGEEQVEVRPEGRTKLELKYEIEGAKHGFEIEIEWQPGTGSADSVTIV